MVPYILGLGRFQPWKLSDIAAWKSATLKTKVAPLVFQWVFGHLLRLVTFDSPWNSRLNSKENSEYRSAGFILFFIVLFFHSENLLDHQKLLVWRDSVQFLTGTEAIAWEPLWSLPDPCFDLSLHPKFVGALLRVSKEWCITVGGWKFHVGCETCDFSKTNSCPPRRISPWNAWFREKKTFRHRAGGGHFVFHLDLRRTSRLNSWNSFSNILSRFDDVVSISRGALCGVSHKKRASRSTSMVVSECSDSNCCDHSMVTGRWLGKSPSLSLSHVSGEYSSFRLSLEFPLKGTRRSSETEMVPCSHSLISCGVFGTRCAAIYVHPALVKFRTHCFHVTRSRKYGPHPLFPLALKWETADETWGGGCDASQTRVITSPPSWIFPLIFTAGAGEKTTVKFCWLNPGKQVFFDVNSAHKKRVVETHNTVHQQSVCLLLHFSDYLSSNV